MSGRGGAFASLDDFANRADPAQLNRRSLENLAAAGAFDALEPNRAAVHAAAETLLAAAQSARDSRESGQGGFSVKQVGHGQASHRPRAIGRPESR